MRLRVWKYRSIIIAGITFLVTGSLFTALILIPVVFSGNSLSAILDRWNGGVPSYIDQTTTVAVQIARFGMAVPLFFVVIFAVISLVYLTVRQKIIKAPWGALLVDHLNNRMQKGDEVGEILYDLAVDRHPGLQWTPHHQDIGITLALYDKEMERDKHNAAFLAYSSIIHELSYRGWFQRFPNSLPLEIRPFFYVLIADKAISEGGFYGYFNNGYGKYAQHVVMAFKEIGAYEKSTILQEVMDSFPNMKYPRSKKQLEAIYEECGDDLEIENEELDAKYYQSGEEICELMVSYVKEHFDKFAP